MLPKTPKEIKKHLDNYIIKQEDAKKILSTALYQHMLKYEHHKIETPEIDPQKKYTEEELAELEDFEWTDFPQNNVLLIGGTGTGKTYLTDLITKESKLPFVRIDCSRITADGWQGDSLTSYFKTLIEQSTTYVEYTHGIIILDEFDKLSQSGNNASDDSSKKALQSEILSILDGNDIKVSLDSQKINNAENILMFPTDNLFIIMAGVFDGLKRDEEKVVGFNPKKSNDKEDLISDLKKFGIIPELIGRIVDIVRLEELNDEDLFKILTTAKDNPLQKYTPILASSKITLQFTDSILHQIARESNKQKTGARSLRKIISKIVNYNIYEHAGTSKVKKILVTESMIHL